MRERGRDFVVMFLARELRTTRKAILEMGSQEFNMWQAYYKEMNRPPEKKTDPVVLREQLKGVFAAHKHKQKKGK